VRDAENRLIAGDRVFQRCCGSALTVRPAFAGKINIGAHGYRSRDLRIHGLDGGIHDELRHQRLAGLQVGLLALPEYERVGIQQEHRLAVVAGAGRNHEVLELETGIAQHTLRPPAHDHHAHVTVDEALQVGRKVLGADVGVHPVGDLAHLDEGGLDLGALEGLLVEVHDGCAVCGGTDACQGGLEFLPVIGAGAAVGDGIGNSARFHLFGQVVEVCPGDGDLVGLGLVHRALGQKQHVGAVDLQRQRNPLATGLVQFRKVRGNDLFVAGRSDQFIETHGRGDLRPGRNLGSLELRTGRRIAGHDLGTQLVHHFGGEAGDGRVLPNPALLLEFLAERRDRRPIAAGRPLRDGGQARLDRALRAGERRQRERGCGSSEQTTPCDHWHGTFLPVSKP
jgi:hypothetical protein